MYTGRSIENILQKSVKHTYPVTCQKLYDLFNWQGCSKKNILHLKSILKKYICMVWHTLKKMIFALCSISLIKMSSYNITLGKNGPNLILLNINNVILKKLVLHVFFLLSQQEYFSFDFTCVTRKWISLPIMLCTGLDKESKSWNKMLF